MVSKKIFLEQIKKLQSTFDQTISEDRIRLYYNALAPDFDDTTFDAAVNFALKNSFKFPPVAAFYKKDPLADALSGVYSPVTEAESIKLRKALAKYDDK